MNTAEIVLDGYLDEETVPGNQECTTARFRLTVSPTDECVDEMIMPCSVTDPVMAHAVLNELRSGDLLRVTGYLRLPRTPDDVIWLQVVTLEVRATAPLLDPVDQDAPLPDQLTLPENGLIERYGPYMAFHDPVGVTALWTEAGVWVGETENPATITDLIDAFERRSAHGEP